MHLLEQNLLVTRISAAIQVVHGSGKRIHKNRPYHGFAYFYGGSCDFVFSDGLRIHIEPGECIYMPKGSWYTVEYPDDAVHYEDGCYAINFHLQDLEEPAPPFKLKIRNQQQMLALFQNVDRLRNRRPIGYSEAALSNLYRIIFILKDLFAREYCSTKDRILLQPAVDYIAENYTKESISIAHLADICGISQSYLRKLFQKVYNLSPVEYARQMRLTFAKELLDSGEYSVTEVAELAGFNDVSYFSREFKKVHQISPSTYFKNRFQP